MAVPSRGVRRFAAITIYILAIGWGVQAAILSNESRTQLALSFGLAVACSVWCTTDAAVRGWQLVWPARIGIFLICPVGVSVYLIWSRGSRGLVIAALAIIGWLAVMFAGFMTAGALAYGAAWFGRRG